MRDEEGRSACWPRPRLICRRRARAARRACPTGAPTGAPAAGTHRTLRRAARARADAVSLQLQWAPQAQFAGYFAADRRGLTTKRRVSRSRSCAAARTSSRRSSAPIPMARVHHLVGAQGARGPRQRTSRTWSTSPRSSSAPARAPSRGRQASGRADSDEDITSPEQFAGQERRRVGLRQRATRSPPPACWTT